jgi:hypothetical protein
MRKGRPTPPTWTPQYAYAAPSSPSPWWTTNHQANRGVRAVVAAVMNRAGLTTRWLRRYLSTHSWMQYRYRAGRVSSRYLRV